MVKAKLPPDPYYTSSGGRSERLGTQKSILVGLKSVVVMFHGEYVCMEKRSVRFGAVTTRQVTGGFQNPLRVSFERPEYSNATNEKS